MGSTADVYTSSDHSVIIKTTRFLGGRKHDLDMGQDRVWVSLDGGISWLHIGYRPDGGNSVLGVGTFHNLAGSDQRIVRAALCERWPGVHVSIPAFVRE